MLYVLELLQNQKNIELRTNQNGKNFVVFKIDFAERVYCVFQNFTLKRHISACYNFLDLLSVSYFKLFKFA